LLILIAFAYFYFRFTKSDLTITIIAIPTHSTVTMLPLTANSDSLKATIGAVLGTDDFPPTPQKDHCHHCKTQSHKVTFKRCSRCFTAFYCSSKCQHANWKDHKKDCIPVANLKDSIVAQVQQKEKEREEDEQQQEEGQVHHLTIDSIKLAVEIALPLCRYERERTLFLLKIIPHWPFLYCMDISMLEFSHLLSSKTLTTDIMLQMSDTLGYGSKARESIAGNKAKYTGIHFLFTYLLTSSQQHIIITVIDFY
jgi:hypothetical protein